MKYIESIHKSLDRMENDLISLNAISLIDISMTVLFLDLK